MANWDCVDFFISTSASVVFIIDVFYHICIDSATNLYKNTRQGNIFLFDVALW